MPDPSSTIILYGQGPSGPIPVALDANGKVQFVGSTGPTGVAGTLWPFKGTLTFEDITETVLFTLPDGVTPVVGGLRTVDSFDAGDANNATVGVTGTLDHFFQSFSTGGAPEYENSPGLGLGFGVPVVGATPVVGIYIPAGTAPTQGSVIVTMLVIVPS